MLEILIPHAIYKIFAASVCCAHCHPNEFEGGWNDYNYKKNNKNNPSYQQDSLPRAKKWEQSFDRHHERRQNYDIDLSMKRKDHQNHHLYPKKSLETCRRPSLQDTLQHPSNRQMVAHEQRNRKRKIPSPSTWNGGHGDCVCDGILFACEDREQQQPPPPKRIRLLMPNEDQEEDCQSCHMRGEQEQTMRKDQDSCPYFETATSATIREDIIYEESHVRTCHVVVDSNVALNDAASYFILTQQQQKTIISMTTVISAI